MVLKGKSLQYLVFLAGSFGMMQGGLNIGWTSPALPQLLSNTSSILMTEDEGSWLASFFFIGSVLGSLLSAIFLDVIGRKTTLLMVSVPFCGTWLIIAYASATWELFLARFIAGALDGLVFCCVCAYLPEVADSKTRGLLTTGTAIFYALGSFLVNVFGEFLDIKLVALASSGFCLGILLCLFIPESPYFYMLKGNTDKARISMELFNTDGDVDKALSSVSKALYEQKLDGGKWWELFTKSNNRKLFGLMTITRFFQVFTGNICVTFYGQMIFQEGKDDVNPVIFISVYYLLQIIVMIINVSLIDKIGRRPLLILSMVTIIFSLLIISTYFTLKNATNIEVAEYSWVSILGLLLFIIGYALGSQNIPGLLVSEVFPLHVKTLAVAVFYIIYGLFGTFALKFFQYTKDQFGMHIPFIAFTVSCLCGLPFIITYIPETKMKSLEDLQKNLGSKQN
ncbi:hypothetical protein FQR65_LT01931 [Abscondita terminalis]|nr:hypothetical protein FQR65_LT01931 [Abscondita terminalis]